MGRSVESPRYHVVNTRLDDKELETLQNLADYREESVAATIRHALRELFASILPS